MSLLYDFAKSLAFIFGVHLMYSGEHEKAYFMILAAIMFAIIASGHRISEAILEKEVEIKNASVRLQEPF